MARERFDLPRSRNADFIVGKRAYRAEYARTAENVPQLLNGNTGISTVLQCCLCGAHGFEHGQEAVLHATLLLRHDYTFTLLLSAHARGWFRRGRRCVRYRAAARGTLKSEAEPFFVENPEPDAVDRVGASCRIPRVQLCAAQEAPDARPGLHFLGARTCRRCQFARAREARMTNMRPGFCRAWTDINGARAWYQTSDAV